MTPDPEDIAALTAAAYRQGALDFAKEATDRLRREPGHTAYWYIINQLRIELERGEWPPSAPPEEVRDGPDL